MRSWGHVGVMIARPGVVAPLVASFLLHAELHRAANRRPEHIAHETVSDVLSALALVDVESGDMTTAQLLPGCLRAADASTSHRVACERSCDSRLRRRAACRGVRGWYRRLQPRKPLTTPGTFVAPARARRGGGQ